MRAVTRYMGLAAGNCQQALRQASRGTVDFAVEIATRGAEMTSDDTGSAEVIT